MMWMRQIAAATALVGSLALPAAAVAQGSDAQDTRPATTTFLGDTGLWFVPSGEVLPAGKLSVGVYSTAWNRTEGYTNIQEFGGTVGIGLGGRFELFGRLPLQRRLDHDARPVGSRGNPMESPFVDDGWQTGFGDVIVGAKVNLLSPSRRDGRGGALALRGMAKIPSATDPLGTGKPDFAIDAIVSSEFGERAEFSAYTGYKVRTNPDGASLSNGIRWGIGFAVPTRERLRLVFEASGEAYIDGRVEQRTISRLPGRWNVQSPADAFVGVNYQTRKGLFLGTGVAVGLGTKSRGDAPLVDDSPADTVAMQFRLGYYPGVRVYVPPPPPPLPPAPPAPVNRAPTVKARCEPCSTEVGKTVTVTADAQDADGDTLAYKWGAPTGRLANAADRQTTFTCPAQPGAVPVTVTVSDGKGGNGSDTVTIQCVQPPRREYKFEDVHFDFDRYSLRPEATRLLDDAIKAMQADATLRLTVEGHTCNIGTAEYNLALGERRASAVREYLAGRGITADRLQTVSYGEERPKHDNSREETRRLNRRASLTVRLQ